MARQSTISHIRVSPGIPDRILLVEDEPAVGMMIVDLLEEAGFQVDGPYETLADGAAALAGHFPAAAVLDIRLTAGDVDLIANDLDVYDIPYVFCSGASGHPVLYAHDAAPLVLKPDLARRLVPTLRRLLH